MQKETNDRDGVRLLLKTIHDEGNPINLDIVEQVGMFKTRKAAAAWIQREEAKGNLSPAGTFERKTVYCTWKPKHDNLRHEIIGTWFRILFSLFTAERGHRIGGCYPDLVLRDGSRKWEVEIDCGTTRDPEKFKRRVKKHKDCDCDLLFVVDAKDRDSETRLKWILQYADRDGLFVTTLDRLKPDPHARVWDTKNGDRKRLPYPVSPSFRSDAAATPQVPSTQGETSDETDGN